jgi:membrane-bound lytic murein transglycosylase D
MKKFLFLIFTFAVVLASGANNSVSGPGAYLSPESSGDMEVSPPDNFDSNLDSLFQDWHIKNFVPIDKNCRFDSLNPIVSDSVIMRRLAKMPTIIRMPFNKVVRTCIDKYAGDRRKQVAAMLGISDYFFPLFEQALEKYNLPNELKYLSVVESALNPNARSRVGATGLWQFMFMTGKIYGLEINSLLDERCDPVKATDAAAHYLKDLYGIFGDWHLAIAAYNCGPGNVNKAIRRAGGKKDYWEIYPYLPSETRGYVPYFIAANYVMTYYKEHKICPIRTEYPLHTDTLMINGKMNFDQISSVIGVSKHDLKLLNPQYRAEIIPATPENLMSLCLPVQYTLAFIDKQDSIFNYGTDSLQNQLTVEPAKIEVKVVTTQGKAKYKTYKVRQGDTLSEIAQKYRTTVSSIKKKNKLKGSTLQIGMKLKI